MAPADVTLDSEGERAESERLLEEACLRAENAALKAEVAALRGESVDFAAVSLAREKAIREAMLREMADRDREHAVLTARLDALIRSSSEVRYYINADWSELEELSGGGFIPDTVAGNRDWLEQYIPEEHRDLVRAEIRRAIEARDTYDLEHQVNRVDGSVGWALSRAVPLFDETGRVDSWIGAASDITDRKASEEMQQVLIDELTHRMKNIFSMTQAITNQTLRQVSTLEEGRHAIGERLGALARAQTTLAEARFAASDIRRVVEVALSPHMAVIDRISIEGPKVSLASHQSLGLSLALHELVTNATKYGALSDPGGRIAISWRNPQGNFVFDWVESGGPAVAPPVRRGFGSRLIENIVASYFDGLAKLEFDPAGLQFNLSGMARAS